MKTRKEFTTDAETIERVLAGLKQVAPSAGMNGRIVRALRQRDLGEKRLRLWTVGRAHAAWAASSVCAAALALTVLAFLPRARSGALAGPKTASVVSRPSEPRQLASAPAQASVHPLTRHSTARIPARGSIGEHERLIVGAHARNRPAPPAPITQQEKLLAELAASGDPDRTDLLNPQVQQQRQTEARAEFNRFFNADKSGDRE